MQICQFNIFLFFIVNIIIKSHNLEDNNTDESEKSSFDKIDHKIDQYIEILTENDLDISFKRRSHVTKILILKNIYDKIYEDRDFKYLQNRKNIFPLENSEILDFFFNESDILTNFFKEIQNKLRNNDIEDAKYTQSLMVDFLKSFEYLKKKFETLKTKYINNETGLIKGFDSRLSDDVKDKLSKLDCIIELYTEVESNDNRKIIEYLVKNLLDNSEDVADFLLRLQSLNYNFYILFSVDLKLISDEAIIKIASELDYYIKGYGDFKLLFDILRETHKIQILSRSSFTEIVSENDCLNNKHKNFYIKELCDCLDYIFNLNKIDSNSQFYSLKLDYVDLISKYMKNTDSIKNLKYNSDTYMNINIDVFVENIKDFKSKIPLDLIQDTIIASYSYQSKLEKVDNNIQKDNRIIKSSQETCLENQKKLKEFLSAEIFSRFYFKRRNRQSNFNIDYKKYKIYLESGFLYTIYEDASIEDLYQTLEDKYDNDKTEDSKNQSIINFNTKECSSFHEIESKSDFHTNDQSIINVDTKECSSLNKIDSKSDLKTYYNIFEPSEDNKIFLNGNLNKVDENIYVNIECRNIFNSIMVVPKEIIEVAPNTLSAENFRSYEDLIINALNDNPNHYVNLEELKYLINSRTVLRSKSDSNLFKKKRSSSSLNKFDFLRIFSKENILSKMKLKIFKKKSERFDKNGTNQYFSKNSLKELKKCFKNSRNRSKGQNNHVTKPIPSKDDHDSYPNPIFAF